MKLERNVEVMDCHHGLYPRLVKEIANGGKNAKLTYDTFDQLLSAYNSVYQAAKRAEVRGKIKISRSTRNNEYALYIYEKGENR